MKAQIAPLIQEFDVFSQNLVTPCAELVYDESGFLNLLATKATAKAHDIDKLDLSFCLSGVKGDYCNTYLSVNPETKTVMYKNSALVLSLTDWVMMIGFKDRVLCGKYLSLCYRLIEKETTALERLFVLSIILPGVNPVFPVIEPEITTKTKIGSVYFILTECEVYLKVGFTYGSVEKRLAAIQTGCPLNLKIAHIIACENPKQVEKDYHQKFANYRTRGEWFNVVGEVKDFLGEIIDYAK